MAIAHAGLVAQQSLAELILLHVAPSDQKDEDQELNDEVHMYGEALQMKGIPFKVEVAFGDLFADLPNILAALEVDLVVVGTHGMRGLQRNLYAENILKLINSMQVLTLVVQGGSDVPSGGYKNLLLPVMDRVYSINKADLLANFAGIFKSTLHVLNFIFEDDEDGLSTDHIEVIKNQFNQLGRPVSYHHKTTSVYVNTYSKSIAQFAEIEECQLIVWVVPPAEENAKQFSDDDKISLILNRFGIPVLYSPR